MGDLSDEAIGADGYERRERPPLIGVTTSEVRRAEMLRPIPEGEPPQAEMALGIPYLRAIEAGATSIQAPERKRADDDVRGGFRDASGTTWWVATR